jgi:hypothetical protein
MMLRRPTLLNTGGSGDLAGRSCDSWQLQETESVTHVVPAQLSPAAQESWLAESARPDWVQIQLVAGAQ